MEIAPSHALSIPFSFDPKSLVRQIVELLASRFGGAPGHDHLRLHERGLARVELVSRVHSGRRPGAYAPRWG
jgi:hypothetical protein